MSDVASVYCWCGLPKDHHDGREMDADGNMHCFSECEPETAPLEFEEDWPCIRGRRPAMGQEGAPGLRAAIDDGILSEMRALLPLTISHSMAKARIPVSFIGRYQRLLAKLEAMEGP